MAKAGIHPEIKDIIIKFANGAVLHTKSTLSTGHVDVEIEYPIKHRAWGTVDTTVKKTSKFNFDFSAMSLVEASNNPQTHIVEKAPAAPAAKKSKK
jgi:ribosomal protein L31